MHLTCSSNDNEPTIPIRLLRTHISECFIALGTTTAECTSVHVLGFKAYVSRGCCVRLYYANRKHYRSLLLLLPSRITAAVVYFSPAIEYRIAYPIFSSPSLLNVTVYHCLVLFHPDRLIRYPGTHDSAWVPGQFQMWSSSIGSFSNMTYSICIVVITVTWVIGSRSNIENISAMWSVRTIRTYIIVSQVGFRRTLNCTDQLLQ